MSESMFVIDMKQLFGQTWSHPYQFFHVAGFGSWLTQACFSRETSIGCGWGKGKGWRNIFILVYPQTWKDLGNCQFWQSLFAILCIEQIIQSTWQNIVIFIISQFSTEQYQVILMESYHVLALELWSCVVFCS